MTFSVVSEPYTTEDSYCFVLMCKSNLIRYLTELDNVIHYIDIKHGKEKLARN